MASGGKFVVLEGLDGAGTTTMSAMVAEALRARDLQVRLTAEPSEGPFGRLLRRHVSGEVTLEPSTAALVFTADRADHLQTTIRPALARGRWVVSDRYLLSTLAYQGAEGVDRAAILEASASFEVPDVTFVLEVPEAARRERMADRPNTDRYEADELGDSLRASYTLAVDALRGLGHRIEVVDASPAADVVLAEILARLDSGA